MQTLKTVEYRKDQLEMCYQMRSLACDAIFFVLFSDSSETDFRCLRNNTLTQSGRTHFTSSTSSKTRVWKRWPKNSKPKINKQFILFEQRMRNIRSVTSTPTIVNKPVFIFARFFSRSFVCRNRIRHWSWSKFRVGETWIEFVNKSRNKQDEWPNTSQKESSKWQQFVLMIHPMIHLKRSKSKSNYERLKEASERAWESQKMRKKNDWLTTDHLDFLDWSDLATITQSSWEINRSFLVLVTSNDTEKKRQPELKWNEKRNDENGKTSDGNRQRIYDFINADEICLLCWIWPKQ